MDDKEYWEEQKKINKELVVLSAINMIIFSAILIINLIKLLNGA